MEDLDLSNQKYNRDNGYKYYADYSDIQRIKIALKLIKDSLNESQEEKFRILDVGCGDGFISEKILKLDPKKAEIYGIDSAEEALKKAKGRGIEIKTGDIQKKWPFEKNFFDLIFAGEIIEHIFDVKKFLDEIQRVLKKNGLLILTTPNLASFEDRIKFLFGINPTHVTPIHDYLHFHIRPFTKFSLKRALKENGFEVEKVTSNVFNFNIFAKKHFWFSKTMAKLLPGLSWNLIVKARKK